MDRWFMAMQLTHVSKVLRDIATPVVCSIAVLDSIYQDSTFVIEDDEELYIRTAPTESFLLKGLMHSNSRISNIGYILTGNHGKYIKHLHTTLDFNEVSFGHFTAFMSTVFADRQISAEGVKSLCVSINEDDFEDDDLVLGHHMKNVAQYIHKHLTGVKHLAISPSYHGLSTSFASHLAHEYLDGSHSTCCMASEGRNIPRPRSSLTCLQANVKFQQARNIPRCTTAGLQKLALFDVPLDFDWSCFRDLNFSSERIVFANLTHLVISYQEPTDKELAKLTQSHESSSNATSGVPMDFPVLQHLEITNAYSCNVLKYGSFPNTLTTLRVSAPTDALTLLVSRELKRVSNLDIVVLQNEKSGSAEGDAHAIRSLGSLSIAV
ncbi:hypothetical protein EV175_001089 [Coemansia sp. RSA 1933]|nr:hypothetical protein EV175_001089 [Coemansia sp. RSA 1933]